MNGTVYLIHFARPFKHARHYLGWSRSFRERIEHHRSGTGARLMAVVTEAGIPWRVVRTWRGDRNLERRLKNRGGARRICPVCRREHR